MQNKRKIARVDISDPKNTRVFLDDGSELVGITSVEAKTAVNEVTTVSLSAYVYSEKGITYEHYETKQRVNLTQSEEASFFRNRNPFHWRRARV
jgi:uncharacterized protein YcfL